MDPGDHGHSAAQLLGNDSAALSETLNRWPGGDGAPDLAPQGTQEAIERWHALLQQAVNDGGLSLRLCSNAEGL